MPRGRDTRHDPTRRVSREAIVRSSMPVINEVFPNVSIPGGVSRLAGEYQSEADQEYLFGNTRVAQPTVGRMSPADKAAWELKTRLARQQGKTHTINSDGTLGLTSQVIPPPKLPKPGPWFAENFPEHDPETVIDAHTAVVSKERRFAKEIMDEDLVPRESTESTVKLVDQGMSMPSGPFTSIKGDTKITFDPSIIEDPEERKEMVKVHRQVKSEEGREKKAKEMKAGSKRRAKNREEWGIEPT